MHFQYILISFHTAQCNIIPMGQHELPISTTFSIQSLTIDLYVGMRERELAVKTATII